MENRRLYYVDWLRVLVILSLIPYHAALTYLRFGSVYIKSPIVGVQAIPFLIITTPVADFFMTLLFFLSGIASYYSFQSRQAGQYIKERNKKLLLPFIFGTVFLCPVQAYSKALYEGFQGNLFQFFPQFFSSKIAYYLGYCHLWFLLYLFVFSMICVPLFKKWQSKPSSVDKLAAFLTKGNRILLPFAFIVLLELFLRPFFHDSQTLVMDWANDAVYLSVFIFGYIFVADKRIQNKVNEYFHLSMVFVIVSLAVLFFVNFKWQVENSNELYLTILWAFVKGIYECSAIVFLICIGHRYLNKDSKQIRYLSKASFPIYIFHFLPVTFFTLLLMNTQMNLYLKYVLVVILSYIAVFVIYELLSKIKVLKQKVFKL